MLNYKEKDLIKNGYVEVFVEIPVEGVEKGDKVFVSSNEFGQLDDNSLVSCLTKDKKTIIMSKGNLKIKL